MKKYILLGAILATGLVQADIAPVVNQARLVGGTSSGDNVAPTGNFDLKEAGVGTSNTRYGIMKVDLSGVAGTVTAATLTVGVKDQAVSTLHVFGVVDSAANGWDWNTDMSWDMLTTQGMLTLAPPLATQGYVDANLVGLGTKAFTNTGVTGLHDFTSANLVSMMNADTDGMLTILVGIAENANLGFREPTSQASIEYTVIPEPGTLGLIACTGIGLLGVRRFFLI